MILRRGELGTPRASWRREVDVVIVGSGGAGLSCLRPLAAAGMRVEVVTKADMTDSSTDWAQGGMAAVWDPTDSFEAHSADTHTAGVALCDPVAVDVVVAEAPDTIQDLFELGARFDKDATGRYDLHREGGHSARRIVHAGGDSTGHEVERALAVVADQLDENVESVHISEGTTLVDILTDAVGDACGVRVLDAAGEIGEIIAPAVVLATGGCGQLWPTTSNPSVATGDGLAAAARAGATVRDVEFMQFHPTLLAVANPTEDDRGVLISEAVRGEGAFLVDDAGRLVMAGKHPLADLAPRDVVSATMFAHMHEYGLSHLFLDATAFGEQAWEAHFPTILRLCRERGVDPVTTPIPVRPGAHYHCGGIAADLDGRTSLPGLYAVGECAATGLHGANRLASNSLPEAVITGARCGRMLLGDRLGFVVTQPVARPLLGLCEGDKSPELKAWADEFAGVSRTGEGLSELARRLRELPCEADWSALSLRATNLATAAGLIAEAAAQRTESRGCHRRSDYPQPRPEFLHRLATWCDDDGIRHQRVELRSPTQKADA